MDGELLLLVVVVGLGLIAVRFWSRHYYSRKRRFQMGDFDFFWVPDPDFRPMFWQAYYDGGSFTYDDGEPVTDEDQIAELRKRWKRVNRPRSA